MFVWCKRTRRSTIRIVTRYFYLWAIDALTLMGFDPPFAEGAEFTEWKTDALANQATTAGFTQQLFLFQFKTSSSKLSSSVISPYLSIFQKGGYISGTRKKCLWPRAPFLQQFTIFESSLHWTILILFCILFVQWSIFPLVHF